MERRTALDGADVEGAMELQNWFGGDVTRVFLRFSLDRLRAKGLDLDKIQREAASRTAEDGVFDGHPWIDFDPVLTVEQMRMAHGPIRTKQQMILDGEGSKIDLDLDPDAELRKVALAIKDAGGDWTLYQSKLDTSEAQRMAGWRGLSQADRLALLKRFADSDISRLQKMISKGAVGAAALGK